MSNLADLVEPLKRELALPGDYDTVFPNSDDGALTDSLADGFSEAQLDGYFSDYTLDLVGPPAYETDPDLSASGGYLIVIYTGMRIIRAQLRALNLSEKYQAGPASYEIERSSTLLREELKYLISRRDQLLDSAKANASVAALNGGTYVFDSYFTRSATNWAAQTGFFPAELG